MTKYNHKDINEKSSALKEIVFGMEDGMVSTLGAITGIAIGSQDQATVILAGTVIIAVESISMGVGSYLSNSTQEDLHKRFIKEEKEELVNYPKEEKEELVKMFIRDGWPEDFAEKMSHVAKDDKKLMLKEMKYRELNLFMSDNSMSFSNSLKMFFAYIFGGMIPLSIYFFQPVGVSMKFSIAITLLGLFALGSITGKYTKSKWIKSGLRILLLGGLALLIGLIVGEVFRI